MLASNPPLQPATRTSVVIAPAAVALSAIRDAMEAKAPRDLTGKRENPIGQLLQNAELGWTITRGPLALTGRPEGLAIVTPLNGTFRLTGQIGAQLGSGVGNITGALGGIVNEQLGKQVGSLTGRMLDQRADMRGNVTLNARPQILPNWRLEPNLTGPGEHRRRQSLGRGRAAQSVARGQAADRPRGRRADRRAAGAAARRSVHRADRAARMGQALPLHLARQGRGRRAGSMAGGATRSRGRRAAARSMPPP